jgi:hypothetical protein
VDVTQEKAGQQIAVNYNNDFDIDIVIFVASASTSLCFRNTRQAGLRPHGKDVQAIGHWTRVHNPPFGARQNAEKGMQSALCGQWRWSIELQVGEGGNYGHHGSKAALNMVGRLLSLDLKPLGVAVGIVHPDSTVRTEEAAKGVMAFANDFTIEQTGTFWAAKGPTQLPWWWLKPTWPWQKSQKSYRSTERLREQNPANQRSSATPTSLVERFYLQPFPHSSNLVTALFLPFWHSHIRHLVILRPCSFNPAVTRGGSQSSRCLGFTISETVVAIQRPNWEIGTAGRPFHNQFFFAQIEFVFVVVSFKTLLHEFCHWFPSKVQIRFVWLPIGL